MIRRILWILVAGAVWIAACEESESQCGAACIGYLTLRLYKAEWADGEHEIVVRYPRYGGRHEARCAFDLPTSDAGSAIRCDDSEDTGFGLSVDATVNVHLTNQADGEIEIELVPPMGRTLTKRVRPDYTYNLVCGQTCPTGDEVVTLDE